MCSNKLLSKIIIYLDEGNIIYDKYQAEKLCLLIRLLNTWNAALNLTSIRDPDRMVTCHIMDCAVVVPYLEGNEIADVGTGAGFPGLVLAILCPYRRYTLIDSVAKKTSFVQTAVSELDLDNVTVCTARSEDLNGRLICDAVVSRAVAPLAKLITYTWNLLRPHGKLFAMKADITSEELANLPAMVAVTELIQLKVPGLNAIRHLVKLERTV